MHCIVYASGGFFMDNQLKRGLLDVCALKATLARETYGYQIIKDIRPYIEIKESTLYPILRRLEAQGLLSSRGEEHNGRIRKYYNITKDGRERLREFKEEWNELNKIYEFLRGDDGE